MFRFTRSRTALALALPALALAGSAHAVIVLGNGDVINLGTLMGNGSDRQVIIDDKLFSFESFTSSQFDASNFSVIGFISAGTNQYGLRNVGFDLTGPFGDGTLGDNLVHEMNIQYQVSVLPEYYRDGVRLCDARLTFNGSAGGDGSFSRVDETIWDLDTNTYLGEMDVYDIAGNPNTTKLMAQVDFCDLYGTPGYRAFEVNKDLKFFAAHENDFATASFVRQEFSQIPSPGALALIGLGGLVARRRRNA
jgi:hypothetical protein